MMYIMQLNQPVQLDPTDWPNRLVTGYNPTLGAALLVERGSCTTVTDAAGMRAPHPASCALPTVVCWRRLSIAFQAKAPVETLTRPGVSPSTFRAPFPSLSPRCSAEAAMTMPMLARPARRGWDQAHDLVEGSTPRPAPRAWHPCRCTAGTAPPPGTRDRPAHGELYAVGMSSSSTAEGASSTHLMAIDDARPAEAGIWSTAGLPGELMLVRYHKRIGDCFCFVVVVAGALLLRGEEAVDADVAACMEGDAHGDKAGRGQTRQSYG
eukprot:scaffold27_cov355-Prasinococcus_capsulatus_cf.AAC.20